MSRDILGLRIDILPPQTYLNWIIDKAASCSSAYCCVANVHQCILAHDDPDFRKVTAGADLLIADSVILQRSVGWKCGIAVPPVMRGAEIMLELCALAEKEGVPIALIGAKDDTVLEHLSKMLKGRFPQLEIAFSFSPPFREQTRAERDTLVSAIAASGARLAFVGLGCPKQERWMAEHKPLLDVTMIGVGAAFDFNSGAVRVSPAWIHKAGFEWLYRLVSEPRRLWRRYLTTSPRFLALLVMDRFRGGRQSSHHV